MKTTLGAAVLLLATAHSAQAQDFSGVFSLGYGENRLSNTSIRVNENSLKGRVRAQMGNGLSFGLQSGLEETYLGATSDGLLNNENIGVDINYLSQNGIAFGAYTENNSFSANNVDLISTSAVGLTGGYTVSGLNLKGFVGSALIKDEPLVDITAFGANASYAITQDFTFAASFSQHSINIINNRNNISTYGLGAIYHPTSALGLHGGFTVMESVDTILGQLTLSEIGLGGSYNVNVNGKSPILTTVELVSKDFSALGGGYSFDTVRLGVTLPLGKAAKNVSVPINSAADRVFQPVRSVVGTAIQTGF